MIGALILAAEEAATTAQASGWFLENVWLIPAIPALSFLLILFFGKKLPRGGSEIGIAAVAIAFILAALTAGQWIGERDGSADAVPHEEAAIELAVGEEVHAAEAGVGPVIESYTWFELGPYEITIGTLVDGLTVSLLFVVTLISLLVHIYSTDYVAGDRRYTHYFAFLSLFTASMLFFVVSESTLQMLVGWELVGVCSFVLIGHWWEEQENSNAALKAFLTNRVGDMGLLIGISILFFAAGGTFSIIETNAMAVSGEIEHLSLLVASVCLIAAVMSKSGQFFLHTWLPDAMAGPTPVSALIHAATMVVAGVYMIARLYGVFFEGLSIDGSSVNLLVVVGATTTLVGASLAFVQRDIKKVLAYSTISQLGYMVLALGVGAWTAAVFHLFTHAFFKACLFLGAGSVSHSVHSFDMKSAMGGLRKPMPQTFWTFMIASLALAGLPPLAGFWSKDEILAGTGGWGIFGGTGGNGAYTAFLAMGMITAALTGAYMARTVYLTFFGEYRGQGNPHESGPRITVPLWILSVFAVIAGWFNLPAGFQIVPEGWEERFGHYIEPTGQYFPGISHATPSWSLAIVSTIVALLGLAAGSYYYFVKVHRVSPTATELPNGLTSRFRIARVGHTVLVNKYYLDWLYQDVIVASIKGPIARGTYWFNQNVLDATVDWFGTSAVTTGKWVYKNIDQKVIDGAVDGAGAASQGAGEELRHMQTGKVQQYGAYMFFAVAVIAAFFIVFV
jgi:NADH-quinone oxidoreductase subunit L